MSPSFLAQRLLPLIHVSSRLRLQLAAAARMADAAARPCSSAVRGLRAAIYGHCELSPADGLRRRLLGRRPGHREDVKGTPAMATDVWDANKRAAGKGAASRGCWRVGRQQERRRRRATGTGALLPTPVVGATPAVGC
jgi:hypothetical protein